MTETKPTVVQVTNISHNVSRDQIKHFLEYIGRVRDLELYPDSEAVDATMTKVAYARFDSAESVDVALHLTNSVMVDRALIVLPYPDENIPDENKAMRVAAPISCVAGMLPPTEEWPANVVNMICGQGTSRTIQTLDAKLVELGLAQYPPLPAKTDPSKLEEIRRTIYVSNLDPAVNAEQLVQFFSQAGEVMFVRMAGDENLPSRNAYVEFTSQRSVPLALAYNGVHLNGRHLKVSHSLSAIKGKPQTKEQEQLSRDIDEAMKQYKDVDKLINPNKSDDRRSSSRRTRSKSRDRSRRHKSRDRDRRRSKERRRSPSPRRSSRRSSRPSSQKEKPASTSDKERRKRSSSRSKDKKRSRSRDRSRRSRSRDKDKDRKRSRSAGRKRDRSRDRRRRSRSKDRKRSRSRDRDRDRKSRRRSSSKDKDRKSSSKDGRSKDKSSVKVQRDYDAEEKDMETGVKEQNGNSNGNDEHQSDIDSKNEDTQDSTAFNGTENGSETVDDNSRMSYGEDSQDPMAALEKKALSTYDDNSQDSVDMDAQSGVDDN